MAAYLQAHADCHLCFVDDGSSDGTSTSLAALASRLPGRIEALTLAANRGKAEAVRHGVVAMAATNRFDLIGYWDADLSTPLDELAAMIATFAAHPSCVLVMGSRWKRLGSTIDRSGLRHALGRVFATAASLLLDLPVYDSQCGAKLMRANAAGVLFGEPFSTKWLFDVEVLARLRNHVGRDAMLGGAAIEVPLRAWREVGGSKLGFAYMLSAPMDLLTIRRRYNSAR